MAIPLKYNVGNLTARRMSTAMTSTFASLPSGTASSPAGAW